jgi:hypothetical protein
MSPGSSVEFEKYEKKHASGAAAHQTFGHDHIPRRWGKTQTGANQKGNHSTSISQRAS